MIGNTINHWVTNLCSGIPPIAPEVPGFTLSIPKKNHAAGSVRKSVQSMKGADTYTLLITLRTT